MSKLPDRLPGIKSEVVECRAPRADLKAADFEWHETLGEGSYSTVGARRTARSLWLAGPGQALLPQDAIPGCALGAAQKHPSPSAFLPSH